MMVRHYSDEDFEQVQALHKLQGLDYELPDLASPTMLVRVVIEDDGRITHAAFLRKTAECYWIFGPGESRKERLQRLIALHQEMAAPAERMGIEDVHVWLPPEAIAANPLFEKTMLRLGWAKPLWTNYSYQRKGR